MFVLTDICEWGFVKVICLISIKLVSIQYLIIVFMVLLLWWGLEGVFQIQQWKDVKDGSGAVRVGVRPHINDGHTEKAFNIWKQDLMF